MSIFIFRFGYLNIRMSGRFVFWVGIFAFLSSVGVFREASAGTEDLGRSTARGAAYALVVSEKCATRPRTMQEVMATRAALFSGLERIGYAVEQIKAGYLEGIVSAEASFPGKMRPPAAECDYAEKAKEAIDRITQSAGAR
ncbi:hypothetical protein [Herbaspirillum rubrisubalbicans]|uniref:hypothetical protein n=1 Tax=Herbaspirillum rubrisubalbicans TaxID=80842 RepID=UPI0015C56903|nr:hypothetical protein [Herbaspirillum rubrisubalbicans]